MRQRSGSGSAKSCFDRELEEPAFGVACLAGFCGGGDVAAVGGGDVVAVDGDAVGAAVCLAVAGVDAPALAVFEDCAVVAF